MSIRSAWAFPEAPPTVGQASTLPTLDRVEACPTVSNREPREALLARLADNPHLPSLPAIVLQILEQASRLDCTPDQLASVIHRDPVLCGKILKTVNSALYNLPRSISSIERAVALLGFKPVRSLVLGLSLPAMQRQTRDSADRNVLERVGGRRHPRSGIGDLFAPPQSPG